MHRLMLLTLVAFALGSTARADIPPPLPPAKEAVRVKIEVDDKAKAPRLVIPNGVFTQPRFRPQPKDAPKGALEQENTDGIADNEAGEQPRGHLLIAGLALACSLAF